MNLIEETALNWVRLPLVLTAQVGLRPVLWQNNPNGLWVSSLGFANTCRTIQRGY